MLRGKEDGIEYNWGIVDTIADLLKALANLSER